MYLCLMKYKSSFKRKGDAKKKRMRNACFLEKYDDNNNAIKFMNFVFPLKITVSYIYTTYIDIDGCELEYDIYIVTGVYCSFEKKVVLHIYSFGDSSIFFSRLNNIVTDIIQSLGVM